MSKNEPMDPSVQEVPPTDYKHRVRTCFAGRRLSQELTTALGEGAITVASDEGCLNGWKVVVGLRIEAYDKGTVALVRDLLTSIQKDPRIEEVRETESGFEVVFKNNPRTYDDRTEFNIADALAVLGPVDEEPVEGPVEEPVEKPVEEPIEEKPAPKKRASKAKNKAS